jgi:hypothetical protein
MRSLITILAICLVVSAPHAQDGAGEQSQRIKAFDTLLDLYVRGGDVYYRALKSDRAKLDAYVAGLATVQADSLPRDEQLAFWLNAYDALVLRTVVDHYPIAGKSSAYPSRSIRQIPGAFEKLQYKAGGKTVTLDQIEQSVLSSYHDPRVYFAIGRGAIGSGRLRSEAFTGARVQQQLADAAAECDERAQCLRIDREAGKMFVSSIFSWRQQEFVAAYADKAPAVFAQRSPIERAVIAFVEPKLLTIEKDMVSKNAFSIGFEPFDWTLNDLTGRGGR